MNEVKVLHKCKDYKWDKVECIDYKPKDAGLVTFNAVTRQNIFVGTEETKFDMRYFECASGGYTTLEKHQHEHIVVILRGSGKVVVGDQVLCVKEHDLIVIPSNTPHQLLNATDGPFGFICTVNSKRDKFTLLTANEIEKLKESEEVRATIQIPSGYCS